MGATLCQKDSTKTASKDAGQESLDFEKSGDQCFNNQEYPQAAFWFFQHRMYQLGGQEYPKFQLAITTAGKEWEAFDTFLSEHYKHGTVTANTEWPHVEMLWNNMEYERTGGVCYNDGKYPEAAFWFFQHRMHRLDGKEYPNVALAVKNAGTNWNGFDKFLEEQHENRRIKSVTEWPQVEQLWKNSNQ